MLRNSLALLMLFLVSQVKATTWQEANNLLEQKKFSAAKAAFEMLAKQGSVEAQQSLGEMYWYGDGEKPDAIKAEQYFNLAANAGNARAKGFQKLIATRKEKYDEILLYTKNYRGDDLRLMCKTPEIPELSKSKREIKSVAEELNTWQACFNKYVENYNAALPPASKIPKPIAELLNDEEADQSQKHLSRVYAEIADHASHVATSVKIKETAWRSATETYLLARQKDEEVTTREYNASIEQRVQHSSGRPATDKRR